MFKSKHSGWTWDLKRTPFGGGGGGFFSPITDAVSSVSDALASIDPGPAIGQGLAEVDKGVNQIPGGWYTLGGLAAGGTALAFAPEIAALAGVDAGTTIGSELGQQAFFDSLASGASSTEAINAGLAADAAATASAASQLAGPTYQELGYTGLGEGMAGPTYGELGYTGLNNAEAIAAADAASKGMSASDVLSNANRAKNLANMLNQGATSGLTGSLGKLAQGANPMGSELLNVVRGNQNPFTFSPQLPIQDTTQAKLASLLKQG
jgi:hypothetical protein